MTRIHLLDHIGIHVPYQIEYFATVDFCIGTAAVRATGMEYGKHWRQRLSVTIIRGRVMVVTAVAARERGRGNGEVPEEISAHSLG